MSFFALTHVEKFVEYSKKAVVNYVRSAVQRTESILEKLGTGASLKDGPIGLFDFCINAL